MKVNTLQIIVKVLCLQVLLHFNTYGQSIQIWHEGNSINQGDVVNIYSNSNLDTLFKYISGSDTFYYYGYECIFSFKAENVSALTKSFHVKKYELNLTDSAQTFMCWDRCLSPANFQSISPVEISSNSVFEGGSFHYKPRGSQQNALVAYTFFDNQNQNDSFHFVVNYIPTDTISSIKRSKVQGITIYPNPAKEFIIVNSIDKKIVSSRLIDSKGQNVLVKKHLDNETHLDISNLKNGIYFLIIDFENSEVAQSKLIIAK